MRRELRDCHWPCIRLGTASLASPHLTIHPADNEQASQTAALRTEPHYMLSFVSFQNGHCVRLKRPHMDDVEPFRTLVAGLQKEVGGC